ncbi:hypothetical protein [Serratia proteamaculans]|uniref:Uncharacterized protein n=1 Tax=Serratia proteamaculans TaxID=28151 RepID=A0A5Q2VK02_SERPR|nr:hypothetical protein [Serratia proteamaculans]QGH64185.1 hypothetical protein GHV41_26445 [Serratia proteamaculans]
MTNYAAEVYTMANVDAAQQIEQFKKIAAAIVVNVKTRITNEMAVDEIMHTIHEEILSFFVKQQQMAVEYMTFNEDQRADFSELMYSLVEPLAVAFKGRTNPKYAAYVATTGNTGARNFMVNA